MLRCAELKTLLRLKCYLLTDSFRSRTEWYLFVMLRQPRKKRYNLKISMRSVDIAL